MKLSKNRLHRIKRKKNGSKKKKVFRKNKRSHQNTQKKHHKQPNLKNKTLKIYVGGADVIPETKTPINIGVSSNKNKKTSISPSKKYFLKLFFLMLEKLIIAFLTDEGLAL